MDASLQASFDWIDSCILEDFDYDFSGTFCWEPNDSRLEIKRYYEKLEISEHVAGLHRQDVATAEDLESHANSLDSCQIYCIRQKHSYARLNVTRDLFEKLVKAYTVFHQIWDFLLPFSFKTRESDIAHAPFRFRQLESVIMSSATLGSFECSYGFRYVELNGRQKSAKDNPDWEPWSVRQSAIYQQYDRLRNRTMFILISPSEKMKSKLEEAVCRSKDRGRNINSFDLHRIILSVLHENWRLYIRSLEKLMTAQSDRVTLTRVQDESEQLSPLSDFVINFVDRQRLKMLEDKVLDLVIIFESLGNTLSKMKQQCQKHCLGELCLGCTCSKTIEELEEQMHEVQVNLKKVEILHKRAQGTAQLLSDLLDYENAQIAHLNEQSLNGLVKETKDENSKMRILTERSAQDAAAVKILTVITLIYLPITVVANFFSTQLIHVDGDGQVSVASGAWWVAVVATPLTVATFVLWKVWLIYTINNERQKRLAEAASEKGEKNREDSPGGNGMKISRNWTDKYVPGLQRHRRQIAEDGSHCA